jgi:hypothetical protein
VSHEEDRPGAAGAPAVAGDEVPVAPRRLDDSHIRRRQARGGQPPRHGLRGLAGTMQRVGGVDLDQLFQDFTLEGPRVEGLG